MSSLTPEQRLTIQSLLLLPTTNSGSPLPPSLPASNPTVTLADLFLKADFKAVLFSDAGKRVLREFARRNSLDGKAGLSDIWSGAGLSVDDEAEYENAGETTQGEDSDLELLIVGITLLHSFIQLNWTGPSLSYTPSQIFSFLTPSGTSTLTTDDNTKIDDLLHNASVPLLALGGEPAYHLCQSSIYLLVAIRILESLSLASKADKKLVTVDWWLLRAQLVHESILDEPVPLPSTLLESVSSLLDNPTIFVNTSSSSPTNDILSSLQITLGLSSYLIPSSTTSSTEKNSQEHFLEASRLSGLEWELTGALGKRTKFQVREMSQLVLVARSKEREGEGEEQEGASEEKDEEKKVGEEKEGIDMEGKPGKKSDMPETLALNDDTLLEQTQYTSSSLSTGHTSSNLLPALPPRLASLNPQNQPPLHPLDQCILLCMCLSQHNTSPENGLTASQMSPYLDRVLSHPRNWSVHTTALLLRARLESKRSRTVERSALQLQALVDQMPTADSSASERLRYFHQLTLPSKWEMEKELATRFLSLGVVRSALEIFERLEMWEEAVRCYVSMERKDKAIEVVKDLLEGKREEVDIKTERLKLESKEMGLEGKEKKRSRMDNTRQAKLWCLLGDLEPENSEEYYAKAWEISNHTSSRSQRSLGGLYLAREAYPIAIPYFQAALKINPLYARTWFALGCCLVREERWAEAREAFSRNVGLEEEDGEAWNNLAAVYLRLDENAGEEARKRTAAATGNKSEESLEDEQVDEEEADVEKSVPFENKRLAFRALQQGLRYSRENWRMWQNFMVVAVDVGELSEAARALGQIIDRQARKDTTAAVDEAVLSKLVDAVTREDWNGGKGNRAEGQHLTSNEGLGLYPIVERLFNDVILPKVSDSPKIYIIQARLMRWKEDWSGALECYLRAWRSGPANDAKVETDLALFKEVSLDLEELVDVMRAIGPKAHDQEEAAGLTKGKAKWGDWRFSAKTLVRTFMGRTKQSFEDEPEFERLKEVVAELRN